MFVVVERVCGCAVEISQWLPRSAMSVSDLKLTEPLDMDHYGAVASLARVVRCQAYVRRWHGVRLIKRLKKNRSKREKLMMELLETEVTYVQKLGGVTQIILEPLEWNAQVSPDPLLPKQMIVEIFSNIKAIYELNKTLLHDLDERIRKNWSPTQRIGDVFLQLSPHLPLYSFYYNQHDKAIQMLDKALTKFPNFVDFLDKCKNHPDFVNMKCVPLCVCACVHGLVALTCSCAG